jgi:hypothetical protein
MDSAALLTPSPAPVTRRGALFSPCGTWRYTLERGWDSGPACLFVMLNPSTADFQNDDPTVAKCQRYARRWGYGELLVANLFALRATDPRALYDHTDPVGPENDDWIQRLAADAALIVCAWGVHGAYRDRGLIVARALAAQHPLHTLAVTKDGHPGHPLYLPESRSPIPWTPSGS